MEKKSVQNQCIINLKKISSSETKKIQFYLKKRKKSSTF